MRNNPRRNDDDVEEVSRTDPSVASTSSKDVTATFLKERSVSEDVDSRLEKIKGAVIDPALVMRWAREGNKRADLIVISMTSSHQDVSGEDLWTELEQYYSGLRDQPPVVWQPCNNSVVVRPLAE